MYDMMYGTEKRSKSVVLREWVYAVDSETAEFKADIDLWKRWHCSELLSWLLIHWYTAVFSINYSVITNWFKSINRRIFLNMLDFLTFCYLRARLPLLGLVLVCLSVCVHVCFHLLWVWSLVPSATAVDCLERITAEMIVWSNKYCSVSDWHEEVLNGCLLQSPIPTSLIDNVWAVAVVLEVNWK